jgi:autotransporter-associated beta strand protein
LDNSGSPSLIAVNDPGTGTYLISAPVVLNGDLNFSASAGSTLTIDGNISESSTSSLTVSGAGTLVLSGTNTYSGGTLVSSGTLTVASSESLLDGSSLTVGAASAFPSAIGAPTPAAQCVAAVPEPGTLVLVLAGLIVGFGVWRKRGGS